MLQKELSLLIPELNLNWKTAQKNWGKTCRGYEITIKKWSHVNKTLHTCFLYFILVLLPSFVQSKKRHHKQGAIKQNFISKTLGQSILSPHSSHQWTKKQEAVSSIVLFKITSSFPLLFPLNYGTNRYKVTGICQTILLHELQSTRT